MITVELLEDVPSPLTQADFEQALTATANTLHVSDAHVEVLMCTDARMQELNRFHRGVDKTTDVLSLPTAFDTERGGVIPTGELPIHLGTIVISLPQATRQVGRFGDDLHSEVLGLATHGLRHLLGHDHDEAGEWLPQSY